MSSKAANGGERRDSADAQPPDLAVVAEGFATVGEAAKFLHLSRSSIYELIESGELQRAKFGKAVRVPWVALRAFAARSLVAAG